MNDLDRRLLTAVATLAHMTAAIVAMRLKLDGPRSEKFALQMERFLQEYKQTLREIQQELS